MSHLEKTRTGIIILSSLIRKTYEKNLYLWRRKIDQLYYHYWQKKAAAKYLESTCIKKLSIDYNDGENQIGEIVFVTHLKWSL